MVTGFKVVGCFSNCWVRIGGGRLGVGWVSRWRSGMGHGGDRVWVWVWVTVEIGFEIGFGF